MLTIRRCTVADIMAAPNLADLLAEYEAECSLPELGPASPQFDIYLGMHAAGFLHPIAAFDDERLCGFIFPIVAKLPHYGVRVATIESFFVMKADREKNIGLKLIDVVRALGRELGAKAVIYSAPVGSQLSQLFALSKAHRHSNNTFVEAL